MIVEWLVYAVVLSSLMGVAGWLAARGARAQGWPARWVWLGAMTGSVALPLWSWLRPGAAVPETPLAAIPGAYVMGSLAPLSAKGGEPAGPSLETVLLSGWLLATVGILVFVAVLALRLHRRGRGWRRETVEGLEVLVSRDTGPAALGLVRGRVVLPEWAFRLSDRQRRLLVAHEAEHVRARDPQLAFLGLILAAAAPWNLPLWWQLRRLRLAIEMDCDARVLRRVDDRRGYGDLLLAVGQRRTRLALALAEPRSMLERRIRMITRRTEGRSWAVSMVLAVLAAAALMAACETPAPTTAGEEEAPRVDMARELLVEGTAAAESAEPGGSVLATECARFYLNGDPVSAEEAEALAPEQISSIRITKGADAGPDGSCGRVDIVLDETPEARDRGGPAAVEDGAAGPASASAAPSSADGERGVLQQMDVRGLESEAEGPTFTPMTSPPVLTNNAEAARLLEERYPPLLRSAGIGGTANVWFYIDETGRVARAEINRPSGHEALDQAALSVAREMTFEPARNGDEVVPVWVALDVKFEVQ